MRAAAAILALAPLATGWAADGLAADEVAIIPPAVGSPLPDGGWLVPVAVRVVEPERDSLRRQALIAGLRAGLALGDLADAAERQRFAERALPFLADAESGKRLTLRCGGATWALPETGPDGWTAADLRLPADAARPAEVSIVLPPGDGRRFAAPIALIDDGGIGVATDLDDTLKETGVGSTRDVLAATLLRPYAAVAGMPAWLGRQAAAGAAIHVLSASPWELRDPLAGWWSGAGFPDAHWILRRASIADLREPSADYKRAALDDLFRRWPRTRWILVGDSGERDPEIYGEAARRHPQAVERILIRAMGAATAADPRFTAAFAGLPPGTWHVGAFPPP